MAHMLDETTGKPAIAFVGETPWHRLGQRLEAGAPVEVWREAAGLDYEVIRTPVRFEQQDFGGMVRSTDGGVAVPTVFKEMTSRHVLYRSDTGAPLSVVGSGYKIVQPGEVLDFFAKLAEIGGFELETAGALFDGQRIWGLAKVNDGAPIIGQDVVRPYLLLATSYDGSLATTAKFTAIRVVCHNTLTMSVGMQAPGGTIGKEEADTTEGAVVSMVRVPHSATFDADKVRLKLGIVANVWDRWLIEARQLAERPMTSSQAEVFTTKLLETLQPKDPAKRSDVTKSRGYESIMGLFTGNAMRGSDETGGESRWRMLNAVTEEVDWHRGKSDNSRMASAWFGVGEGLKNKAFEMLRSDDPFAKLETV